MNETAETKRALVEYTLKCSAPPVFQGENPATAAPSSSFFSSRSSSSSSSSSSNSDGKEDSDESKRTPTHKSYS